MKMHSVGCGFFNVWMVNHHQPVRIAWISRSKVSSEADCEYPFYAALVLGTSDDETDSGWRQRK